MEKILEQLKKYKSMISYIVFGVLTTLINITVYMAAYEGLGISNVVSNIIAWVLGVAFAFVTNKIWVFESRKLKPIELLYEMVSFVGCRIATGGMDLVIMYITVDKLAYNSTLMKCISNAIVIVVNYVLSKFIIFREKGQRQA